MFITPRYKLTAYMSLAHLLINVLNRMSSFLVRAAVAAIVNYKKHICIDLII